MSELWFKSAYDLAQQIRSGVLSPVELMQACLSRIDETNPVLNAFIAMRPEQALAEARAMADRIARGEDPGPLAGLPLGVKELEEVEGLPFTHGSVPFKDNRAQWDSVQVERLRAAGAIVLGKTNAPEFGFAPFTKNLLFGVTRNPWNPARTPGGSSGGSAAAVAAGMVPIATGSDGGGSVRIPACYTGCYGIKPTFGRVPRGPFEMLTWSDVVAYGPITRTVRDAALYLDAVVGAHPSDPDSLPHPGISYVETLERLPRRLRIAWSPTLGYAPTLPTEAFDARGRTPPEIDGQPLLNPLLLVAFTYPFNLSGHPAATVRAGFTDAGLPAGLQIVGPRHREDLVLQASYAYEQERPWNDHWPREIPPLS